MNMNSRNTAFIIHSLKLGGSEKFFISLVNNFYKRGYDPLVILLEEDNPLLHALHPEVRRVLLPRRFKYDLTVSARIRAVLKEHGIRKVFCVEPYAFFLARLATVFDSQFRFYLSLHNSLPIGLKKYLLEITYLRLFRGHDKVIFICNYQRDYFNSHYYFRPRQASVIHNGVDTLHFSPDAARSELSQAQHHWRERLGIDSNDKVILMIGRISPEKGHAYAIMALAHLHREQGLEAHLVIVGEGSASLLAELKTSVQEKGLDRFVHFEGGQTEVRHYLLHADVFVMTSVSETFSLAALEALSMGIPCSLTRIGGAPEMLVDQAMGTLCEVGDIESIAASWKDLLAQPHDRVRIRKTTVACFSDQLMLDRYEDMLK